MGQYWVNDRGPLSSQAGSVNEWPNQNSPTQRLLGDSKHKQLSQYRVSHYFSPFASREWRLVITGFCLWDEEASVHTECKVWLNSQREAKGFSTPHPSTLYLYLRCCLLVLEVLNGAQALKGAFYHDSQPGTQRLTFFHAVEPEREGETKVGGCAHPPPSPLGISCLWEVRTTALPSLMMLMMVFHSMRRAWGSMPVVGSSCGMGERMGVCELAFLCHFIVSWAAMI